MKKQKILLVDDNEAFLELFLALPEWEEFEVVPVSSAQTALRLLEREPFDLMVSDVQMPGMSGIELFEKAHADYPEVPVILITAFGSVEDAINAMKKGAFHYFEKPVNNNLPLFWKTVRNALAKGEMQEKIALLQKEKEFGRRTKAPLIGISKKIDRIREAIDEVASLSVTVLLSGETGTGKGLVAQKIHDSGNRTARSFFSVSCTEFAPGILESELFGHEKGAFTGAINVKRGLFEVAHQGTLFLDEIGDAPATFQTKLLRTLESKQFKRVGGERTLESDFRLITASNQDLDRLVARNRFRSDLLFRIKVYEIPIPPLRARKEDIPLITEYYLNRFKNEYGRDIGGISEEALSDLQAYEWPGNVRELINVIERAVITCRGPQITPCHLPFGDPAEKNNSGLGLKEMEQHHIQMSLKRTGGNKTQAAVLLGISRKTLIEKVKRYGLGD